jgi:hypothetical protein
LKIKFFLLFGGATTPIPTAPQQLGWSQATAMILLFVF